MISSSQSTFDPTDAAVVLGELGRAFPEALICGVDKARSDFEKLEASGLGVASAFTPRTVANVLHDLLWRALVEELRDSTDVALVDGHPLRMIVRQAEGRLYRIRMKRHRGDMISSYPTCADQQFYSGDEQTFQGMEVVNLAAGYRWDQEFGEIVCPVISYREGKANVVWTVEPSGEAGAVALAPINPQLPLVDLIDALAETDDIAHGREVGS